MIFLFIFISFKAFSWQKIDLNTANKEQIALLPGIGKSAAEQIIAQRQQKKFNNIEELTNIKGISENKIELIKNLVTFSSPPSTQTLKKNIKNSSKQVLEMPNFIVMPLKDLEEKVLNNLNLQKSLDENAFKRLRSSAALPNLTLIADFDKEKSSTQKKDPVLKKTDGYGFGIKASFDLNKLIFNEDEIALANLTLKKLEQRYELIEKIHKHYFAYTSLIELAKKAKSTEELNNIKNQMLAHQSILDSYSNYEFSNFIKINEFK